MVKVLVNFDDMKIKIKIKKIDDMDMERTGLDKISLWVGVECEVITEVKVVFISRVEVDFFVWLAVLLIVV